MLEQLKNHPILLEANAIQTLCQPLAELGITTFSHLRVFDEKRLTILCNHPKSFVNYMKKKYYEADPCISFQAEMLDFGQYLVWDYVECFGKTKEMLDDSTALDFKHVFTIIKKQEGIKDFYHFGTHLSYPGIQQLYLNNLDLLVRFIAFFNERVTQEKSLSKAYALSLNSEQTSSCVTIKGQNSFLSSAPEKRAAFLSSLCKQSKLTQQLTSKEIACAFLLLEGKTAKEIAKVLALSHRTIEDRIRNIKDKLRAQNKTDLLVRLLEGSFLPH